MFKYPILLRIYRDIVDNNNKNKNVPEVKKKIQRNIHFVCFVDNGNKRCVF